MTEIVGEEILIVEVEGGKAHMVSSLFRLLIALPILLVSLVLYFIGVVLTLTVIGALVGIPLMVMTYGIDVFALALLVHLREKFYRIPCPHCKKGRFVLLSLKAIFSCKECGTFIRVVIV